ncbi:alpha-1,4-glucan--maltose-1-phosphate maltosyltransferase [Actinomyces sp. HMSC06A08]|nr:alpha-1,4-glucan--maltose-1-phosphate maltosyltransferase [Actinomyces sp. HMSC072A03]OFT55515.1 alpha-1,4-glucan--maltose-1-phosphate maltosyltransferase [Actinomyces sp. HMSC06A08]
MARIPVTEIFPSLEDGLWPAKAVEGESFPVRATVFREGHDQYAAEAVLLRPGGAEAMRVRMVDIAPGLDRYEAWLRPDAVGDWTFHIETWADPYATWSHDASIKVAAGIDTDLMLEEGARLLERAIAGKAFGNPTQKPLNEANAKSVAEAIEALRDTSAPAQTRLSAGLHSRIRHIMRKYPLRDLAGRSRSYPLQVDRERALVGAWYEIFPRSIGASFDGEQWHSGTLRSAAKILDRVADLGFDVIYITPIHPIGTAFRKGKNNSLTALPSDPGSPYAIGSDQGGHGSIHPDLGTMEDFDYFVKRAKEVGLEVAMDFALQASPDHPWVREHPEWFSTRADGSIAYAENPPKKYQDIYPLNFDNDPQGIYQAVYEVAEKWIEHGVSIFRVDNPHTKPLAFWQRFLAQMHAEHPEVIFLAEAFTRPAMMRTLGGIGFHQSYTYFAWRTTKEELQSYFEELANETAHILRPTFWPTTHDILTPQMWTGGAAIYAIRAVLAATGSPSYGIYSGYECLENVPRPGYEENNDNEKYEYKNRDFEGAEALGIAPLLRQLNRIRRAHPALTRLRNIKFHTTSSPNLLAFSKHVGAEESPTGEADTVLVVVNLDPHNSTQGMVDVNVPALGLALPPAEGDRPVMRVRDELDGRTYEWGSRNFVDLWPEGKVAHIFSVEAL